MVAQYAEAGTNKAGLGVGVAALYIFLVFFSFGMDAASWVVLSEIFPNFIRAKGYAVAVSAKSLINLVYLQVTPQAFANLGWKYFMVRVPSAVAWLHLTTYVRYARSMSAFLQSVLSYCIGLSRKRKEFR